MSVCTLAAVLLSSVLLARATRAQEIATIEARVLSVSGTSVYLDKGRDAGVRAEDRVVLRPPGASAVEATVRDVSKSTSRAELLPGSPPVPAGSAAEILVPAERLEEESAQEPESAPTVPAPRGDPPPTPPPHPQWTHPPESWDLEMPLLAATAAAERERAPAHFDGRVFWQTTSTWSRGQDSQYTTGSLGADTRVENPFGRSGLLDVSADVLHAGASFDFGSDASDTYLNLRRLSYSEGGTVDRPSRWEVGRFLQSEFPELGMVDGFDWNRRTDGGDVFGANIGAMPEPYPGFPSGEDVQASVYYRWAPKRSDDLLIGAAYQNSWHEGSQDRSLFLGTLEWNPDRDFTLRSAAWVDRYGSEDVIKSSAFELTELQALAAWRFDRDAGLTLSMSHRRIPEMQRHEFASLPPDRIEDDRVDRIGAGGWKEIADKTRLRAQIDGWQDQDDDGIRGEVGVTREDLLWDRGEIGLALFTASGSYSSGGGLRLTASKRFDRAYGSLGYELSQYEQEGFVGQQETLVHQFLYGGLDFDLGKRWSLSLQGNRQFGDELDAYTLGVLLQFSF